MYFQDAFRSAFSNVSLLIGQAGDGGVSDHRAAVWLDAGISDVERSFDAVQRGTCLAGLPT